MSANTYTYTVFNPVSSGTVTNVAVNASGEVAGAYIDASQVTHGFTESGGVIKTVDITGASTTEIVAVNDGGVVTGYSFAASNTLLTNAVGFVGLPGSTATIAVSGVDVEPTAVNAGGEVVGTAGQGSFTEIASAYAPLNVSGAQSTTATAVNAGGEVVGYYIDANGVQHGFTDIKGVITTVDPAGSVSTTIAGVNAAGALVGTYTDGVNTYGFTDVGGAFTTVSASGSTFTVATGINDAGTVVGYDYDASGGQHGVIELGGQIDGFDVTGAAATQPDAINNAGQIVGTFDNASGVEQAFVATAAPNYAFAAVGPASATDINVAGNDSGEFVGSYLDANGNPQGFVTSAGVTSSYRDAGAATTQITAVNAAGVFTGFSSASNGVNGQWFTVTAGGVATDHADNGNDIQPTAINASGEVVGNDGTAGFYAVNGAVTVVAVPNAIGTTVSAVNNAGEIVGVYSDASGVQHGFTDIGGTFATVDPAGSVSTTVAGVNTSGELVGAFSDGVNTYGFTDVGGVFTTLTAPGSTFTVAEAVNDAGTVTGFYEGADQAQHGFVDLGGVISTVDPSGSQGTMPTAINSSGELFGTYVNAAGLQVGFTATPACYCPGAMIRTDNGDVPVERLAIGDRVATLDGACKPVRWIGRRSYAGRFLRGRPSLSPVRILAGALGAGVPSRDLVVSPAHALLLDGALIAAEDLVNGVSILRDAPADRVDYIHIELAEHGIVWANDAAAETFVEDDSRAMFSNAAEYAALYPDAAVGKAVFCAPRVDSGPVLEQVRQRLATLGRAIAA